MEATPQELTVFSEASREAARLGGQVLLKWLGKTSTQEKGFRDLVTQADFESQTVIRDFLLKSFPSHQFVGEESLPETSATKTSDQDFCWIVDPLDGTTNYVHQLRSFSVSIALRKHDQTLVGTVLDPVLDECYWAIKGQGAQLNDQSITTSDITRLEKSLFVFSFGREQKTRNHPEVLRFLNLLENAGSLHGLVRQL